MNWCLDNSMNLNISKCVVMTFSLNQRTHEDDPLRRVWKRQDLGIITTVLQHLIEENISNKFATKQVPLCFPSASLQDSPLILWCCFFVLWFVPSSNPTNSLVWAPYQTGLLTSLERVQVLFIRILGCKMGYCYLDALSNLIRSQFN